MPQSVHFQDRKNLERAKSVFNSHPDLTIFARDNHSCDFLRDSFSAKTNLCPDIALALRSLKRPVKPIAEQIALLRTDKESVGHAKLPNDGLRVFDWLDEPDFEKRLNMLGNGYPALNSMRYSWLPTSE